MSDQDGQDQIRMIKFNHILVWDWFQVKEIELFLRYDKIKSLFKWAILPRVLEMLRSTLNISKEGMNVGIK